MCGACYDRWLKSTNEEYRQRQIVNTTNWMKIHPDKRKLYNERRRVRELADPFTYQKKRERTLKTKYGLSQAAYDELLSAQDGGCKICFRKPGKRPLHVDHCHATGIVRGLLCHQCNWYLGTIDADKTVLERLIDYVK